MQQLPIRYFSFTNGKDIEEQLHLFLQFENAAGDVKCETGIDEVLIDFNAGVRVQVPNGNWHVRISDADSGLVAFDEDAADQLLISAEKYFIRWQIEIFRDGELVFEHTIDLTDQVVYFYMQGGCLGDTIALLPYLRYFKRYYGCTVCVLPPVSFKPIIEEYYPEIELVEKIPDDCYAAYCLAAFQKAPFLVPTDGRLLTIDMLAKSLLNLPENAPKVSLRPTSGRLITESYVCIGVQASGLKKRWLHPGGWRRVVKYLKSLGYRVLCIDGENSFTEGPYRIAMPVEAEDFTGMLPLQERINLLAYADFFIGLGSGLSWLANACDIPVVLISGFSLPYSEFETPYRVMNRLVCHGCYNDVRVEWKTGCPYHQGSDREYECSKKISYDMVKYTIDRLIADKKNVVQAGSGGL